MIWIKQTGEDCKGPAAAFIYSNEGTWNNNKLRTTEGQKKLLKGEGHSLKHVW